MFSCPIVRFTGVLYEKFTKHERWIFLLFLVISLLQLWMTRFIPSLDGPQHLYNANVMVELLKGNELMRSFFDINEVIVGYWSGHFFLAFGYWIRHQDQMNWQRIFIFGLIVMGIFLSHGLVYLFFGLSFIIYFLASVIYKKVAEPGEFNINETFTRVWKVSLAILPSLVLWIIYIRSVMFINNRVVDASYSLSELIKFLMRIRLVSWV